MRRLPVVNRHCGDCTACCTVLGVPEENKGRYTPCKHENGAVVTADGTVFGADIPGVKKGCSIYDKRPKSCRDFKCMWLLGLVRMEERPDKTGILWSVTTPKPGKPQRPVAMEVWPGAAEEEPGKSAIEAVLRNGHPVIIVDATDKRRIVGYAMDPNDPLA